jgi:hypothetical protein
VRLVTRRYTTPADPLSQLVGLVVLQPGSVLAVGLFWLLHAAHADVAICAFVSGVVLVVTALATALVRRSSVIWRVRRAMISVGLVQHHEDGHVQEPRPLLRGRRWDGENVSLPWLMPPFVTLAELERLAEEVGYRADVEVIPRYERGQIVTEIHGYPLPDFLSFDDLYHQPVPTGRCVFGVGASRRGPLFADFAVIRNLLAAGETGSGKSSMVRQLLVSLALRSSPDDLGFAFVDLKGGLEMAPFALLPHTRYPVADSIESAAALLENLRAELDRRLMVLRHHELTSVDAYNEAGLHPKLARLILVVDELAELSVRDVGGAKTAAAAAQRAALSRLSEIGRLGRALALHLLISVQRPDAETLAPALKANLPTTAVFRVRNAVNSQVILDSDRAARIPPSRPGRGLWVAEHGVVEMQAPFVSDVEARRLLADRWGNGQGTDLVTRCPQPTSSVPQPTDDRESA